MKARAKKIFRGELLTEVLKQVDGEPMPFERQVVALYAALNGYMDDIPHASVKRFEAEFLDYLDKRHEKLVETIQSSKELSADSEAALKSAIDEFKAIFYEIMESTQNFKIEA